MYECFISPCGMNCRICVSYFGYTLSGKNRKSPCKGCKSQDKQCNFLKNHCEKLSKNKIEYCHECEDFPCENLEKLDNRYRKKYDMSMISNLKFIRKNGIKAFLKQQEEKYKCPECGGTICVHTNMCYNCET